MIKMWSKLTSKQTEKQHKQKQNFGRSTRPPKELFIYSYRLFPTTQLVEGRGEKTLPFIMWIRHL